MINLLFLRYIDVNFSFCHYTILEQDDEVSFTQDDFDCVKQFLSLSPFVMGVVGLSLDERYHHLFFIKFLSHPLSAIN